MTNRSARSRLLNSVRIQKRREAARLAKPTLTSKRAVKTGPKPKLSGEQSHELATLLAKPGDPLVTSDGQIIEPEVDINKPNEHQLRPLNGPPPALFRAQSRRTAGDISANGKVFNAVAVIFAYTLFGLSDTEIMDLNDVTPEQLDKIREHKAYDELFNSVLREFVNTNAEILRSRVAAYAHLAMDKVGHLSQHAKQEALQLSASRDILSRAGVGPDDQSEADQMNEFRITVVSPDKEIRVEIDASFE